MFLLLILFEKRVSGRLMKAFFPINHFLIKSACVLGLNSSYSSGVYDSHKSVTGLRAVQMARPGYDQFLITKVSFGFFFVKSWRCFKIRLPFQPCLRWATGSAPPLCRTSCPSMIPSTNGWPSTTSLFAVYKSKDSQVSECMATSRKNKMSAFTAQSSKSRFVKNIQLTTSTTETRSTDSTRSTDKRATTTIYM